MENKKHQIELTTQYVKSFHQNEATGHDWFHINRVNNLAKKISNKEGGDLFKVELIALLHDVADHKLNDGDEKIGLKNVEDFLLSINIEGNLIIDILSDIENISFKGAGVEQKELSLEGMIVQDADRIDAIGAIGIARTFAYGGNKNRMIYDPESNPEMHTDFVKYKSSKAPTINHFYEKLLLLKDRLNTSSAKEIAEKRHQFMEMFLCQFYKEWNCD
ncbi:HD domain-containing protein [Vicingus serpentipes]|uniref:HD domain-containing protein n=1 Tax=Vicingus serpentipes TaxID=1926625 RepID=A0A5C6RWL7_9FLAO|nr:HD domain-containing protein [Vicingus serpentipes]TXB66946.1 HD domain-containing protein [Vicingus serpentipes]